jgi:hypothetical protein
MRREKVNLKHIITTLALVASTAASAQFYTGNQLLERMDSEDPQHKMLALGYVAGTVDMTRGTYHCAPWSVSLGQVRDLMQNSIRNDPVNRHLSAAILVAKALVTVWPCEKTTGSTL